MSRSSQRTTLGGCSHYPRWAVQPWSIAAPASLPAVGSTALEVEACRCKHRIVMVEPSNVVVRRATPDDLPFIQLMLYEAANRPGDTWPTFEESMNEARNSKFGPIGPAEETWVG